MKAELTKDGTLRITPQTECEAYALSAWQAARGQRDKAKRPALEVLTEPEASGWLAGTGTGSLVFSDGTAHFSNPRVFQTAPTTTQPWPDTGTDFPDTGGVVCP